GVHLATLVSSPPSASPLTIDRVQRTILQSLHATDMSRWAPALDPQLRKDKIPGPTELDQPPLYYSLAAAVTAPFSGFPVLARLAILRALGVALAGVTLWACGMAGRLLWPGRRWREAPMAVALAVIVRLRRRVVVLLATVIVVEMLTACALLASSHATLDAWAGSPASSNRCEAGRSGRWAICLAGQANNVTQSIPYPRVARL